MTDGIPAIGSTRLAEALAAQDVEAIGLALRMDVVVVPQLVTPDGERQVRVFPSGDPAKPHQLFLFSTGESFARFLAPDDDQRSVSVRPASDLLGMLDRFMDEISIVGFDPAGPSPMWASPQDVRAAITPRAADDPVAWVSGRDQPEVAPSPGALIDFEGFHVVDTSHGDDAATLIRTLIGRSVAFMARERQPVVRQWGEAVLADAGAQQTNLGVRVIGGPSDASILALWPLLIPADGVIAQVESEARARGELVEVLEGAAGRIVRHEHTDGPSLLLDHWSSTGSWALRTRASIAVGSPHEEVARSLVGRIAAAQTFVA